MGEGWVWMDGKRVWMDGKGKPPDNGTNTFINRLESKGKFWIILLEYV